MLAGGKLRA